MDGYPIWPPLIPNSDEEQRSKFLLYGALVFEWVWKCKNQTLFENKGLHYEQPEIGELVFVIRLITKKLDTITPIQPEVEAIL
ncbi:hypothetical protein SO802_033664 [Lithocarpus litseifolius]|uniref:Uncharacterized protein n=1 Tax=Lithocarpus litseifolius TaxID=425828 RepID=A0AAW2BH67_9ROSI